MSSPRNESALKKIMSTSQSTPRFSIFRFLTPEDCKTSSQLSLQFWHASHDFRDQVKKEKIKQNEIEYRELNHQLLTALSQLAHHLADQEVITTEGQDRLQRTHTEKFPSKTHIDAILNLSEESKRDDLDFSPFQIDNLLGLIAKPLAVFLQQEQKKFSTCDNFLSYAASQSPLPEFIPLCVKIKKLIDLGYDKFNSTPKNWSNELIRCFFPFKRMMGLSLAKTIRAYRAFTTKEKARPQSKSQIEFFLKNNTGINYLIPRNDMTNILGLDRDDAHLNSPLKLAITSKDVGLVRVLLQHGQMQTDELDKIESIAFEYFDPDVFKELLPYITNKKDFNLRSLCSTAITRCSVAILKVLVEFFGEDKIEKIFFEKSEEMRNDGLPEETVNLSIEMNCFLLDIIENLNLPLFKLLVRAGTDITRAKEQFREKIETMRQEKTSRPLGQGIFSLDERERICQEFLKIINNPQAALVREVKEQQELKADRVVVKS